MAELKEKIVYTTWCEWEGVITDGVVYDEYELALDDIKEGNFDDVDTDWETALEEGMVEINETQFLYR